VKRRPSVLQRIVQDFRKAQARPPSRNGTLCQRSRYDTAFSLNPHNPTVDCRARGAAMDSIIYLVGLVVVVMFVLSILGLH
jgi:hypothetical protein